MDLTKSLGFRLENNTPAVNNEKLVQYINLKLSALGQPIHGKDSDSEFLDMASPLLSNQQAKNLMLSNFLCPVDRRIQTYLNDALKDTGEKIEKLPTNTFILDRHGLARMMSLPPDRDYFASDLIKSYRIQQGILHNPRHDRRTTAGVFHVAEGGFPIPDDKRAVPKLAFARMFNLALHPPDELLNVPFTASQKEGAKLFISLMLKPTVCPEVPGFISKKHMEIRFFAPASLISNLDFVESIFGNAGDPYLAENDSALDVHHWTGHTGCVILAPHLSALRKKDAGLPHYDNATERQRRDGMCWKSEEDLYNDGKAFKVTSRDERGVMVTLIADNYFGYCKKEVKTQISFSSNLYGLSEEEHAGGAIAFPSYDLGEKFKLDETLSGNATTFKDIAKLYKDIMDLRPEGYGIDKRYRDIVYVPENAQFTIEDQTVRWESGGKEQKIKLMAFYTYVLPSGYKIHVRKQTGSHNWILVGTVAEGTLCHKPCTVSGGGKSEISKSIVDAMIQAPVFTADFQKDMDVVAEIIQRDFGDRFKVRRDKDRPSRPILSPARSLGSVIKLFTPSPEFSDTYNQWLKTIPHHIKDMVFVVKRHYRKEWGENWRQHFSVDIINGHQGHELKYNGRSLVANYIRVGHEIDGSWRTYKVRQDFSPAQKVQVEDDITASIVVSSDQLNDLNPQYKNPSVKLVSNCEYRLFQRPDDAIKRGYDKQAEQDLTSPGAFLSNYEPLPLKEGRNIMEDWINFDLYTQPVKELIREFVEEKKEGFIAVPSHPRMVDGKPSKNPRYLQDRPDIVYAKQTYLSHMSTRIFRKVPLDKPLHLPVNAVLPGRRNNPPDKKQNIPPLAVYNPIHYQELPELFLDFVCSVTGKSPSTTGFGSEGALTKGPFNALWPVVDLNNALISYILTGYDGYSSAAGYVGPNIRVDHDISLLIPELWSRMSVEERAPRFLIENGYLEKLEDFEYEGRKVRASMLGYRITLKFVHSFFGRIFNNPNEVFSPQMLQPEKQDLKIFVDGLESIFVTQKRVAQNYFDDGSIEAACPPLKALLHIMAHGSYDGKELEHPEVREMFTPEYLLKSDWYIERLNTKQARDIALWKNHVKYLEEFIARGYQTEQVKRFNLNALLEEARKELAEVSSDRYRKKLHGTLGADPLYHQMPNAEKLIDAEKQPAL